MLPALSQVCTLQASFSQDIEDFAAGQCHAVDVWLTKLEDYLQRGRSVSDVRKLLLEHEVAAPVASYQGGLFGSNESGQEAWKLFGERLVLCGELEIETLVVACDILAPICQADVDGANELLLRARPLRRSTAFVSRWSFEQTQRSATTSRQPPHLCAKSGTRTLACVLTCFTITWAPASKKISHT